MRSIFCTVLVSAFLAFVSSGGHVRWMDAGRTARAGRGGFVTSLYDHNDIALVKVLHDAVEHKKSIESVFSRRRGFKKRIKKKAKKANQQL